MIDLSTIELRHLGQGDIVQFFGDRSSVDVASVYARVDELESLQLATLFTASPKLLAALKNLLGQVELFCSQFGEADFETAQATGAVNEAEGNQPNPSPQIQSDAPESVLSDDDIETIRLKCADDFQKQLLKCGTASFKDTNFGRRVEQATLAKLYDKNGGAS